MATTEDKQCGICYLDLTVGNSVATPCNHLFCSICFFTWLGRKETCALCRAVVLSNTLVDERLTEISLIEDEAGVYREQLRLLNKKVKKKGAKLETIIVNTNALLNRQIRLRELLDKTRKTCSSAVRNSHAIKETMKMHDKSINLLKKYRTEWSESIDASRNEYMEESKEEESKEEEKQSDIPRLARAHVLEQGINGWDSDGSFQTDDIEMLDVEEEDYFEDIVENDAGPRRYVSVPQQEMFVFGRG